MSVASWEDSLINEGVLRRIEEERPMSVTIRKRTMKKTLEAKRRDSPMTSAVEGTWTEKEGEGGRCACRRS